jgi:hypothetical protein
MEINSDSVQDLSDHREKCRLCLKAVEDEESKAQITEKIQSMIFELQIQVCLFTNGNVEFCVLKLHLSLR